MDFWLPLGMFIGQMLFNIGNKYLEILFEAGRLRGNGMTAEELAVNNKNL